MQILTGGSFVKLENKEKIENLIFTAKEMANAAVETDGFASEPENNRRLALEIWQGAEYMTLDHEEAQVKNLFVGNFLDRLREIGGAVKTTEAVSQNIAGAVETPDAAGEIEPPKDEFLGLISTEEIEEKTVDEPADAIELREIQTNEITVFVQDDSAVNVETNTAEVVESPKELTAAIDETTAEEIKTAEPKSETVVETKETSESASSGESQTENASATAKVPGAIALPEKEPYRWEKCTITTTIQLLPMADDDSDASSATSKRRAVLSVRTHDFAPQFSVVELSGEGESILSELLPALGQSFEKYKTDLPLKVMDKMKREKSAAKKQSSKTTVAAKTSATNNSAADSQPKPDKKPTEKIVAKFEDAKPATTATTVVPKSSIVISAESGQQGSLFGF